jgi:hypothetical protein
MSVLPQVVLATVDAAYHDCWAVNDEARVDMLRLAGEVYSGDELFAEIKSIMGEGWVPSDGWQFAARRVSGTARVDQVLRELGCL